MRPIANPQNRFERQERQRLEPQPPVSIRIIEDDTKDILSRNDSPDLPFRWSLNPFRGCFHACAYCYARPSHEYWGFGAGTDFDSQLMIKPRAPELLRQAFERRSWHGEPILFSGNTDCYQPLEATYGLTRACLKVCAEYRNPVTIITKAALITRDLDVLLQLQAHAWIQVYFSIPFADNDVARAVEPQAPTITKRLEAMRILSEAGIHTGVSLAPIIPGLNDDAMADILSMARQAGAQDAMYALLRLTGSVETVFLERMAAAFPDRLTKITNRLREVRGGTLSDSGFFTRHQGQGTYWKMIEQLFQISRRKAGFPEAQGRPIPQTFRRPDDGQTNLFDSTEI